LHFAQLENNLLRFPFLCCYFEIPIFLSKAIWKPFLLKCFLLHLLVVISLAMSNPIADDADYFNTTHQGFHRSGAPNALNIRKNDHLSTLNDVLSPASPTARRQHSQQVPLDGTPRARWQNLVQRLSSFQSVQDNNDNAEESPHRSLWERQAQAYNEPTVQDDTLPTPEQLYQENETLEEDNKFFDNNEEGPKSNFFESPFEEQQVDDAPMQEPEPAHVRLQNKRPILNDSQISTPQASTYSGRSRKNVFSSFLARRGSSGDIDNNSIAMIPTESPSTVRHSSQRAEGKPFSKFPISNSSRATTIHGVPPKPTPITSLLYIPSLITILPFSTGLSTQNLVLVLTGGKHLISSNS
jgi:hypothetical protein